MKDEGLCEDWLKIIHFVIKKMGLQKYYDDLIDVAYIGFVKAFNNYREDKSKFMTYACFCIENEIKQHLRVINAIKRGREVEVVSYNQKISNDIDKLEIIDSIPDKINLEEFISNEDLVNSIVEVAKKVLNEKEYEIFDLFYLQGLKQRDILKIIEVKNISRVVGNINKKIKNHSRIRKIKEEIYC